MIQNQTTEKVAIEGAALTSAPASAKTVGEAEGVGSGATISMALRVPVALIKEIDLMAAASERTRAGMLRQIMRESVSVSRSRRGLSS